MALFLPLEDEEFWSELMKTDKEFRDCIRDTAGLIEIEIPLATLELSIDLSIQIETRVVDLQAQVDAIISEIPCLDIIVDFLEGQTNPEAISLRNQMIARRAAKEELKSQLETQINTLTPQIDLFAATKDTLIVNTKNASFLGGIVDDIESGAC